MRKLREAALVAAMVGSVSMFGAATASAGGQGEPPTVVCEQNANENTATPQIGLINVGGGVLSGGNADSSATQQICGIGNDNNENEADESDGGDGLSALVVGLAG